MSDDKRALLLAFVEWCGDHLVECPSLEDDESSPRLPEDKDVVAFLAQHFTTTTEIVGNCIPFAWPPARHLKVTEVVGHAEWSRSRHGSEDFCILGEHESAYGLDLMLPDETLPPRLDNGSLDLEKRARAGAGASPVSSGRR
jgi:hypothetical protein